MVTDDKLDDGLLDPFLLFVFRVSALVALRFFFLSLTFQSCTRVYQIVNFKNYTAGMCASF